MNTIMHRYSRRLALVYGTAAVVLVGLACGDHPLEVPSVSLVTGSTFVGDQVRATKPAFIRTGPGSRSAVAGKQPKGALGIIVGGPVAEAGGSGRTWWSIDFDQGVDGWGNGQDYEKVGSAVAAVEVTPAADSLPVGGSAQLAAVARDLSGRPLTGKTFVWLSRNAAVATVTAAGLVAGMMGGATYVVATSEGQSDSAQITVSSPSPPPPAGVVDLVVSQSVSQDSVLEGSSVTFTVRVTNRGSASGTSVVGADTLASGLTYASHATSSGSSYSPTSRVWTVGVLPAGGTQTLSLTATVNQGTGGSVLVNRAGALAAESDSVPANNASTASVVSLPAPVVDTGEPVDPGAGYRWEDNFDRYASPTAMMACPPNQYTTQGPYFTSTVPNHSTCGQAAASKFQLTTGRSGSGNALRSVYQPDPQHNQQSLAWLSPWWGSTVNFGTSIAIQFWTRVGVGQSYLPNGGKFFEVWWTSGSSGRIQWGNNGNAFQIVLGANPGGTVDRTFQPVDPHWSAINDGRWHRVTLLFKANTSSTYSHTSGTTSATETYAGTSSRNGRVAMWIDGVKILDYSQATVGVTPSGGSGPWCRQGDVDMIPGLSGTNTITGIGHFQFPEVANGTDGGMTIDHDDLKVWAIP